MVTMMKTPNITPAFTATCGDAYLAAGQDINAYVERIERRTRLLTYIRDVRNLLEPWGIARAGEGPQAYRDRWSSLCRQLCENGKPVLIDVSLGNPIPAEVLI